MCEWRQEGIDFEQERCADYLRACGMQAHSSEENRLGLLKRSPGSGRSLGCAYDAVSLGFNLFDSGSLRSLRDLIGNHHAGELFLEISNTRSAQLIPRVCLA